MIEVDKLIYEYPGIRALDNVSLSCPRGSITALVGPNGAGKSTLLRCLAALDQPIVGQIEIDGVDVIQQPRASHKLLGYLADSFGLYDQLTVRECLNYVAQANGLNPDKITAAINLTAERLDLTGLLDRYSSELSRGQRQRVAIGQAIIHAPKVLIMDEPASGLDPEARHTMAELFTRLRGDGMTLLVSSHILAELEAYSTAVVILREGRVVEHRELKPTSLERARLRMDLARAAPDIANQLAEIEGLEEIETNETHASFSYTVDAFEQHELLKRLIALELPIVAFGEDRPNLQDNYLEKLRDEP